MQCFSASIARVNICKVKSVNISSFQYNLYNNLIEIQKVLQHIMHSFFHMH